MQCNTKMQYFVSMWQTKGQLIWKIITKKWYVEHQEGTYKYKAWTQNKSYKKLCDSYNSFVDEVTAIKCFATRRIYI